MYQKTPNGKNLQCKCPANISCIERHIVVEKSKYVIIFHPTLHTQVTMSRDLVHAQWMQIHCQW